MNDWVVVVDDDAVSRRQMDVCKLLKPPLHGAIECNLDDNAEAKVCLDAKYFPAFCNVKSNECVYGLRTTMQDMEALVETPINAPSQRTTDPTPPQGMSQK